MIDVIVNNFSSISLSILLNHDDIHINKKYKYIIFIFRPQPLVCVHFLVFILVFTHTHPLFLVCVAAHTAAVAHVQTKPSHVAAYRTRDTRDPWKASGELKEEKTQVELGSAVFQLPGGTRLCGGLGKNGNIGRLQQLAVKLHPCLIKRIVCVLLKQCLL